MTLDDLKIDYTKYTTQELMDLLPKTIQWRNSDGRWNEGYSLFINYDSMVVSYSSFTIDNSLFDLLSQDIKGFSVEDLNDALYRLLVDIIYKGYLKD